MLCEINNLYKKNQNPDEYKKWILLKIYNTKKLQKSEIDDYFIYFKELLDSINSETPKEDVKYLLSNINYKKMSELKRQINDNIWGYYSNISFKLINLFKNYGTHDFLNEIDITEINNKEIFLFLIREKIKKNHWFVNDDLTYWKIPSLMLSEYVNIFKNEKRIVDFFNEKIKKRNLKRKVMDLFFNKKEVNMFYFTLLYDNYRNLNYDQWINNLDLIIDTEILEEQEFISSMNKMNFIVKYLKDENKINFLCSIFSREKRKDINHYYDEIYYYLTHNKVEYNKFKNFKEILAEVDLLYTKTKYSMIDIKEDLPLEILNLNNEKIFFQDFEYLIKVPTICSEIINIGTEFNNCLSSWSFLERLIIQDIYLIILEGDEDKIILSLKKENNIFLVEEASLYLNEMDKKMLQFMINSY